ncbi:Cytochrome P450 monooxygenase 208 [Psilocybe cubensis]|uniref:Cytochrome P450 monooxygenase 208 n=1 Tax=Psilocybe cubensis TaxID=181762 RepID=A0ACB8GQY1_PSICU|nr:Cytochrome P450 monooxygenase 208 [Psilocybe cubensis]KAH9477961.1 Cytochrome P450 monooxygenase 208 [Psilocybe cubensis]
MQSAFTALLAAIVLALITRKLLKTTKEKKLFPPGPKGLPLIGNALDFPTENLGPAYTQWGKQYNSKLISPLMKGDILHASAFGSHVIIVNNRQMADELFDRRAVKHSDRPSLPALDLSGMTSYNLGVMRYGDKWRLRRKHALQIFRQAASPPNDFSNTIVDGVHKALKGLLHSPENLWDHNKMLSISIPMSSMYGYDAKSTDDPCIVAADQTFTLGMELSSPGGSLINIIPLLRHIPPWIPGAISQRKAEVSRKLTELMISIPLEFTKARVAEGNARPSVVGNFLEKKNTVGVSEEEEEAVMSVASTAYAAGSDTTQSATGTFLYLMVLHPDIQKKAQAEIDSVLGGKRLPTYEDRPSMPYIEAIYREVLRWRPPGSVGFPHSSTEDDFYGGYFIPKGSTLMANIWAMTHDETRYENPLSFNPERFINPDGTLNDDDRIMAFGFGRRYVRELILWLTFASILAVFNLENAKDKSGNIIKVNDEYYEFGLIRELVEQLDA